MPAVACCQHSPSGVQSCVWATGLSNYTALVPICLAPLEEAYSTSDLHYHHVMLPEETRLQITLSPTHVWRQPMNKERALNSHLLSTGFAMAGSEQQQPHALLPANPAPKFRSPAGLSLMQAQSTSAMRGVSSCSHWLPQSPHSPLLLSGKAQAHLMFRALTWLWAGSPVLNFLCGKSMPAASLPNKCATSYCMRRLVCRRAWLLLACSLAGCVKKRLPHA